MDRSADPRTRLSCAPERTPPSTLDKIWRRAKGAAIHVGLDGTWLRCLLRLGLHVAQVAALETVIDEAVAGLDRHLLQTLFNQYALQQHCDALKRYLLLGQGDFIESLMDLIGAQLDKPVRLPPPPASAPHIIAAALLPSGGCRP